MTTWTERPGPFNRPSINVMPDQSGHQRIGRGFNLLSGFYDASVRFIFGSQLINLQKELLDGLSKRKTCLIIGGGTGEVLRYAQDIDLADRYYYAELSTRMLAKAKAHLTSDELRQVTFGPDWKRLLGDQKVDYIVLPFVLDCYPESAVRNMIQQLKQVLADEGQILIIDFNEEPVDGHRPTAFQQLFIQCLYLFFAITTSIEARRLPRILTLMPAEGFRLQNRIGKRNGWLLATCWSMSNTGSANE